MVGHNTLYITNIPNGMCTHWLQICIQSHVILMDINKVNTTGRTGAGWAKEEPPGMYTRRSVIITGDDSN